MVQLILVFSSKPLVFRSVIRSFFLLKLV